MLWKSTKFAEIVIFCFALQIGLNRPSLWRLVRFHFRGVTFRFKVSRLGKSDLTDLIKVFPLSDLSDGIKLSPKRGRRGNVNTIEGGMHEWL